MKQQITKKEGTRAFSIGFVCVSTYLVSYCVRNLLSVLTPAMCAGGAFTEEFIGTLSSVYLLFYALGQLVNGRIGDVISPKYMVLIGLSLWGVFAILFSFLTLPILQVVFFGFMGFSLSMLRGPLVKTICENSPTKYAHVSCVFLSFTASAGPLIASIIALAFEWNRAFFLAGIVSMVVAVSIFLIFTIFEKKQIIHTVRIKKARARGGFSALFKLDNFVLYMIVGMVCEIASTAINFWLPTYINQRLGFGITQSNFIFSAISVATSITPFVTLALLVLWKNKDVRMMRFMFFVSAILFAFAVFFTERYVNIILVVLSLMALRVCSSLLWSVYIPNQAKSGLVSSLNGFLDFSGYVAATIANLAFSLLKNVIGWDGIVWIWAALALVGAVVTLFHRKSEEEEIEV